MVWWRRCVLILVVLFALPIPADACVNYYDTVFDAEGKYVLLPIDSVHNVVVQKTAGSVFVAATNTDPFGVWMVCLTDRVAYDVIVDGVLKKTNTELIGGAGGSSLTDNLTATVDPVPGNDSTQSYGPGSKWVNTVTDHIWWCVDASVGGAIWIDGGAVYNPRNYGAICAGTATDDTANIRRMLTAAPAGADIFIPGLCSVAPNGSGPILPITKNVRIHCPPGGGFKIKDTTLVSGVAGTLLATRDATSATKSGLTVEIDGCTLDGNDTNNTTPGTTPPLVELFRAYRPVVKNNYFRDTTGTALKISRASMPHVESNYFFRTALTVAQPTVLIDGSVQPTVATNTFMNHGEGVAILDSASPSSITTANVVIGNTFTTSGANVLCAGSGLPFSCCTGTAAGSSAGDCATGEPASTVGPALVVSGIVGTVTGNSFYQTGGIRVQSGLLAGGGGATTWNQNIADNMFWDIRSDQACIELVTYQTSGTFDTVHVTGNMLDGCSTPPNGAGIKVHSMVNLSTTGWVIEGNDIKTGIGVYLQGEATGGGTQYGDIVNNQFHEYDVAAIKIDAAKVGTGDPLNPIKIVNNHGSTLAGGDFLSINGTSPVGTWYTFRGNSPITKAALDALTTAASGGITLDSDADLTDGTDGTRPCTGGGSGAHAVRVGSAWSCDVASGLVCAGCVDTSDLADWGAANTTLVRNPSDTGFTTMNPEEEGQINGTAVTGDCVFSGAIYGCTGSLAAGLVDFTGVASDSWDGTQLAPFVAGVLQWRAPLYGANLSTVTCSTDAGKVPVNLLSRAGNSPNSGGASILNTPVLCDTDAEQGALLGTQLLANGVYAVLVFPTPTPTGSATLTPVLTPTPPAATRTATPTPTPTVTVTPGLVRMHIEFGIPTS